MIGFGSSQCCGCCTTINRPIKIVIANIHESWTQAFIKVAAAYVTTDNVHDYFESLEVIILNTRTAFLPVSGGLTGVIAIKFA